MWTATVACEQGVSACRNGIQDCWQSVPGLAEEGCAHKEDFTRQEDTSPQQANEAAAKAELDKILELIRDTVSAEERRLDETSWNEDVHKPVLRLTPAGVKSASTKAANSAALTLWWRPREGYEDAFGQFSSKSSPLLRPARYFCVPYGRTG
ncbi:hypothetical protein B0T18DRAFT_385701 [Schizothecium vesticola]|uniref:PD-(D/E)XK nuclease-like domain-containing protein n=1 Tax=Schizothecium vesticola TaxID=314040 RepID=A0AA40F9J0_9PEZI|nr:hypothetical protein B0T18DRAFT_385701 [Schizothecium vesticola]